jgi:3'(2'), 5'-bisphosphate nucleotidase
MASTTSTVYWPHLVSACVDLAEQAGVLMKNLAGQSINISTAMNKFAGNVEVDPSQFVNLSTTELLTEADLRAQKLIVGGFKKYFPDLPYVGEEDSTLQGAFDENVSVDLNRITFEVPAEYAETQWSDLCAFIDPLDGTKEFCLSNFECVCVLIGVTFKGRPVAGVLHEPWFQCQDERTLWDLVGLNRNLFSSTIPQSLDVVISANPSKFISTGVERLKCDKIMKAGGTGHKLSKLLRGEGNFYLQGPERTARWDICACEALFRFESLHIWWIYGLHKNSYSLSELVGERWWTPEGTCTNIFPTLQLIM